MSIDGKRIYQQAMAKGGGSFERQARHLLGTTPDEFDAALSYVKGFAEHPEQFVLLADEIVRIHSMVNMTKGKVAPIEIDAKNAYADMLDLLDSAKEETIVLQKKKMLESVENRLRRVRMFKDLPHE